MTPAVRIAATLCIVYMLSQFYRAANAVIGPDLMREISLGADDLGWLTGVFFVLFAASQIPAGMLLDRYGPRRVMAGTMGFAVVGALIFAIAGTLGGLSLGRALLGIGSSCLLMGPLVVFARWFPPDRFATVTAILIGVGSAGSLLATAPMAAAAQLIGWRGAFYVMAAITALFAVVVLLVVRDAPPGHAVHGQRGESLAESLRGLGEVLRNRRLPLIFPMNLTSYAAIITLLGLWGGPYLHDVHGLDGPARGNVLLVMAVAAVASYLAFGPLDRVFDTRKRIVLAGTVALIAALALLAVLPQPSLALVTAVFGVIGAISGYQVMVIAHGRAIFPDRLVGRGVTTLNIGTMGGAALMQVLTGYVIEALTPAGGPAPEIAYRAMFATVAAVLLLALLVYSRLDDARPSLARSYAAS